MPFIAITALAVVGLIAIARALPRIEDWALTGIKPWACDLCMSFWATVILYAGLYAFEDLVPTIVQPLATLGLAFSILKFIDNRPPPAF